MSAYVVHNDTIDLLIAAADAWRVQFDGSAWDTRKMACSHRDEAGQLLLDENYRSVNARYREDDKAPVYSYRFVDLDRAAVAMPIPVLVLQSVRCLRYQSCETEDYATTNAAIFLDRIEHAAISKLTDMYDPPWGFTRDWMETKRADIKRTVNAHLSAARD